MTLVCPVGPGERNEQLRFMLRSVATHLPGARVVLAGHRPSWVQGVEHIPVIQGRRGWGNVARILHQVCEHPSMPEKFVLVNDDFYAMVSDPPVPLVHRGPLDGLTSVWRAGWYSRALAETLEVLRGWGIGSPLAYDRVHQPMPVVTEVMGEALAAVAGRTVLHRSLYGNLVGGGALGVDVKARGSEPLPDASWVSTAPTAWHRQAGRAVRKTFRDPCRYEK